MANDLNVKLREWERQGWTPTKTTGGHWKLTHPRVRQPFFTGSTPSDIRALRNIDAQLRRALALSPLPSPEPAARADQPILRSRRLGSALDKLQRWLGAARRGVPGLRAWAAEAGSGDHPQAGSDREAQPASQEPMPQDDAALNIAVVLIDDRGRLGRRLSDWRRAR